MAKAKKAQQVETTPIETHIELALDSAGAEGLGAGDGEAHGRDRDLHASLHPFSWYGEEID